MVFQYLAVDVKRLNVSLLRWFREGVAAALGVPARHVHIHQLNVSLSPHPEPFAPPTPPPPLTRRHSFQEEKNGIEIFVSSDRRGVMEPRPAEEVIQSLNVRVLHRHLGHFGITEVSSEVGASLVTMETQQMIDSC